MGRYGLQTDQWARIAHLLLGKNGDVGVTAKANKLFAYLVAVMDWFNRRVLAWRLSVTLEADFWTTSASSGFGVA